MKKVIILLLLLLLIIVPILFFRKNDSIQSLLDENNIEAFLNEEGYYTGFDNLDDYNSLDDLLSDDLFAVVDHDIKGLDVWQAFFDKTSKKENAYIRLLLIKDANLLYCYDLLYIDEEYFLFQSAKSLDYRDKTHVLNLPFYDLSPVGFDYLLLGHDDPYSFIISDDPDLDFKKLFRLATSSAKLSPEPGSYRIFYPDVIDYKNLDYHN